MEFSVLQSNESYLNKKKSIFVVSLFFATCFFHHLQMIMFLLCVVSDSAKEETIKNKK